jgi:hypothetical protein
MTSRIDSALQKLIQQVAGLGSFIYRLALPFRWGLRPSLLLLQWLRPRWLAVWPMWFPALVAVAVILGLATSQGRDVLLTVADKPLRVVAFIVALGAFCIATWYFSRVTLEIPAGDPDGEASRRTAARKHAGLRSWAPRLVGAAPAAMIGVWYALEALGGAGDWRAWLLAFSSFMIAGLVVAFTWWRRRLLDRQLIADTNGAQTLGWLTLWFAVSLTIFVLVTLPFDFWRVTVPTTIGTIPVALAALASWIAFVTTVLVVPTRRYGLFPPLVILLVAIPALWNYLELTDNHLLAVAPTTVETVARMTPVEHFDRWLAARDAAVASTSPSYPVVFVAAEGGGIRAAYWTALLLARLEDRHPGFACHIYAISGVSGGSLGAAVFDSLVADRVKRGQAPDCTTTSGAVALPESQDLGPLEQATRNALDDDFLAPTAAGLVFPDLIQRFVPVPLLPDRQAYLERAWEIAWAGAVESSSDLFGSDFLSLWRDDAERMNVPSLLLNTTEVDLGRRSIVSNLVIEKGVFFDASDALDAIGHPVRVSTAAGLSARFTYVSPAASVRNGGQRIRLVDGGYFENSGTLTLRELINGAMAGCKPGTQYERDCGGRKVLPVVLVIRNGTVDGIAGDERSCAGSEGEASPCGDADESWVGRLLGETLPPITAVLNTRVGRGEHDRRGLEAAGDVCAIRLDLRPSDDPRVKTVPLGWVLAEGTREYLHQAARSVVTNVENELQVCNSAAMVGALGPAREKG